MNKIWKYLIAVALLTFGVLAVAGCSQWDSAYKTLDEEGKTVSVRFDANGGIVASKADAIVDVFNINNFKVNADGKVEISLLDPSSGLRTTNGQGVRPERTGYFLAGWYAERTPRVDENGNRLDMYGEIIPEGDTETEQGYIYGGKWDFEKDTLELDPSATYTSAEPQLTLYAAWVPYFSIEFYAQDENGVFRQFDADGNFITDEAETETTEETSSETETGAEKKETVLMEIVLPVWNEENGKLDMKNIPKRFGMTFDAAYLDEAMTLPAPAVIQGPVDEEKGICTARSVKIYTTWKEGNWFRIYTAKQLCDNVGVNNHYDIRADLDFTGYVWPNTFATTVFQGSFVGNGHTISNVKVTQGNISNMYGGLFGILGDNSTVRDITFENTTYLLAAGSNKQGATFGAFVGQMREGATLENVTFNGILKIGAECWPQSIYAVNLLIGSGMVNGQLPGVTHRVDCELDTPEENNITYVKDVLTGAVTLTFPE